MNRGNARHDRMFGPWAFARGLRLSGLAASARGWCRATGPCQRPGTRRTDWSRMAPQRQAACGEPALVSGATASGAETRWLEPATGTITGKQLSLHIIIQFEFCFQMENGNGILKTRGTLTPVAGHGGRPGGRHGHGHGGRPRANLKILLCEIAEILTPTTAHHSPPSDDDVSRTR
jgi:hypothetical protein